MSSEIWKSHALLWLRSREVSRRPTPSAAFGPSSALAYCLRAAVKEGELVDDIDCGGIAKFIIGGLQGAILLARVKHSPVLVERFEQILFGMAHARPDMLHPARHACRYRRLICAGPPHQ